MARDKKALSTGLRLILLEEIGQAVIDQGSEMRDIVRAIESETERAP
jgi:3-dehydroquinate synthetase